MTDPTAPARRAMARGTHVLACCAVLVPPLGVLAPLGLAPLFTLAPCAILVLDGRAVARSLRGLAPLAALLLLLALWATASALWSILPRHSLADGLRFVLIAAGGIVLIAAARTLAQEERRYVGAAAALGLGLAIALLLFEVASGAALARLIAGRPQSLMRYDRGATTLVLALWPALAATGQRGIERAAIALAAAATVFMLKSDAASLALVVGFLVLAVAWRAPRFAAAMMALGLVLAAIALPLATPGDRTVLALRHDVPAIKWSGIHRLLIWRFTADRIGERPILGWGMDASRALPGGKTRFADRFPDARIPADAQALPLHPHNAVLQWEVELGIPGTILCLAVVAWGLWRVGFAPALAPGVRAGALAWAASALVVALLAYGIWQAWWLSCLFLTAATYAASVSAAAEIPADSAGIPARDRP
jgi:O-antigen ligase